MINHELVPASAATIAVLLASDTNARLLNGMLGEEFQLRRSLEGLDEDAAAGNLELVVVDIASLRLHRELIRQLRRGADPKILPVLLVVDSRAAIHLNVALELGRSVDDILRVPTCKAELRARIDNLLRLRCLSRQQDESRRQISGVVNSLRTLNVCDQVIVRSKTEEELINELCRSIVDQDGYSLAWIGFASEGSRSPVEIRACAGPATDFVPDLIDIWATDPDYPGPTRLTIRTGLTCVVSDIEQEMPASFIVRRAQAYGIHSLITLPLKVETGPPGCLAIHSDRRGHFGRAEQQLLERLADNLAFGLNALRAHRERAQQAAEIHYMAYTDALTGLPNRRHLVHYLDGLLADPHSASATNAILFIDLDGFKLINDALGHQIGDEVLKQVGHRLKGSVRECDLVVRQGGDEFLVVMADDPRKGGPLTRPEIIENAHLLAERIIQHLSEPLLAGGYSHRIKASVGISLCPDHGSSAVVLIENADKAMYEAKRLGGARGHLFSEDISTSRQERFSKESRLRQALEEEQFELYYQPVFELESCKIVAVEALIRWPQKNGEIVMPGSFMPLVEETDLIHPLGDWVLETAARQLRVWHDRGLKLAMAVNLSINQLACYAQADHFANLVRPHVNPSWIHLEVTENALMTDPAAIEGLLAELQKQGFQVAIDDFGTGYSSLSRLQHLSIQTLKIDRSFVNELGRPDSKGSALVAIIQQMAANLNLHTIAEGIETDEQRQLLLKTSSPKSWGQGFWFSPAVPAEELEKLVREQGALPN